MRSTRGDDAEESLPRRGEQAVASHAVPRPVRLDAVLSFHAVDTEQHLRCAHRPACLLVAGRADWPGMSCRGCGAVAITEPVDAHPERIRLAAFGEAIGRLPPVEVAAMVDGRRVWRHR